MIYYPFTFLSLICATMMIILTLSYRDDSMIDFENDSMSICPGSKWCRLFKTRDTSQGRLCFYQKIQQL